MRLAARHLLDRSFTAACAMAIVLMGLFLAILLGPILWRGAGAVVFKETIEHQRFLLEQRGRGNPRQLAPAISRAMEARRPVFDALRTFEEELSAMPSGRRRELRPEFRAIRKAVHALLGPDPDDEPPVLMRKRYGQTRWDRALVKRRAVLMRTTWDYSGGRGRKVLVPRAPLFEDTALAPVFTALAENLEAMLAPRWTFYGRFFFDDSRDAHFFGGIGPEMLGTVYLTLGAMLLALPLGVIAAIYFHEYSRQGPTISALRAGVNTLAGVPSIVFGLFGLAFFINTLGVSDGKSVLAGALTLALLILPTIIRAAEEALRAVPRSYREAALALGAGKWRTIVTVILPAAVPGILTGVVISMGRAAGETAPIIFTAAVSVGRVPGLRQLFSEPTPALSWNIYNLATEHESVDEIRHVQYGMVATLVGLVLLLNLSAIVIRARVSRNMKGFQK